jgi:1-acyl-sn-glycerol-3-phosphate acyltransferase
MGDRLSIVYLLKLALVLLLGPVCFVAAMACYPFSNSASIELFEEYLRFIFRIFGIQLRFEFDQPETQESANSILVVLNQSSFLDSLACVLVPIRPTRGIINFEFALYPVIGWLTALISFTIVRQWPSQAKRTLNRAGAFLRAGGNVLISIEGKRSRDGRTNEYKKGPVVMAINNQSNLVPVIIYGSRTCLPYGSLRARPGTLKVRFLEPIPTRGLSYEDRNRLRDKLIQVARAEGLSG